MSTHAFSLITVILGISLLGAATIPVAEQRLTISGTLAVVEEDMHGAVKTLELDSPQLGRFLIVSDGRGRRLFPHAGQWVTVTGTVEIDDGARKLRVEDFRLVALQSQSRPSSAL